MYLKCSRQFEFRYVDGLKAPPGVALVEGSSYHDVIASANRVLMTGGKEPNARDMVEEFVETFSEKSEEIQDWEGETKGRVIDRSEHVLGRHADSLVSLDGKPTEILAVESKISLEISGVPVIGYLDMQAKLGKDKVETVYDYKFSNRVIKEEELTHHLQLCIYAIDAGKNNVGIVRNERKIKGKHEIIRGKVNTVAKKMTEMTVENVAKGVVAGAFPATDPSNWWCGPKWCGYWSQCRGCQKFSSKVVDMKPAKKKSKKKAKAKKK
jgi:hypothetical protein